MKSKKGFPQKKLIYTPCESIINTVLEKKFTSPNRHSGINVNVEVTSISSQTENKLKLLKK